MSKFLDKSRDIMTAGLVDDHKTEFESLLKVIHKLKGSSFCANIDLNNIETVLSLLELGAQIGGIEGISLDEIEAAQAAAPIVIGLTIDYSTRLTHVGEGAYLPVGSYKRFVDKCIENGQGRSTTPSVITFNYDCALNCALKTQRKPFSYYLSSTNSNAGIPLLKLHGSINWQEFKKESGEEIKPFKNFPYTRTSLEGYKRLLVAQSFLKPDKIDHNANSFIIPPMLNKLAQQKAISAVWKKAAECLRLAQEIYVIGYSLPETDTFFKYLFALSTYSEQSISRFWVFDPDPKVGERFKALVGVGLAEPRFKFHEMEFKDAIDEILKD